MTNETCLKSCPVLQERDDQIQELSTALRQKEGESTASIFPPLVECDGPRRSRRIASSHKRSSQHEHVELESTKAELAQVKAELEQCRADLDLKQTELTLKTLGTIKCHIPLHLSLNTQSTPSTFPLTL